MAVYTETILLKDEVTAAAKKASLSLEDLSKHLDAAHAGADKGLPTGNIGGGAVAGTKDMWAGASQAAQVGKESITSAIGNIRAAFSSLAAGDVKGAVTGLFDALGDLSKMLDLVVPGLGQAVSAAIKLAGGLVGITAGLIQSGMEFAIESNQAKQAMLSMFDAMGGGVTTGAELDDMLSELSDTIGISKDSLAEFTKSFLKMGVTGKDQLQQLTLAAASANAIVGEGGAAAFTSLQKKIQTAAESGGKFTLGQKQLALLGEAGTNVAEVAKKMGMETKALTDGLAAGSIDAKKFGDALTEAVIEKGAKPLERLASSFGEIKKKFMQDIGDLFEDIDVGPFMAEVKDLFSIFGQGTASGQALKAGIQGFFQETFNLAKQLVPYVKMFLLDLVIYGLQAYIALKPIVAKVKEFLASSEGMAVVNGLLEAGKYALIGLGIAVGVVVGLFVIMATATVAVGLALWSVIGYALSLGATVSGALGSAVTWIIEALVGLAMSINEELGGWPLAAVTAAYNFISGLVQGIIDGGTMVVDAVKNLAGKAVDTFTDALGIGSPSKVMAELGVHMGSGLGQGLDDGAGTVATAASSLGFSAVDATAKGGDQAASASASGSRGAITVYVTIEGAGKSASEITEEMVSTTFERMALAEGL